jgi:2,4-dienoyl-CoA reductase-like NADH-dependent reductase (Old Yellow Enzyme family)
MSRLFQPLSIGTAALQHRVAMAPLTRYRWGDDWDTTGMKDMIIGMLRRIKSFIGQIANN